MVKGVFFRVYVEGRWGGGFYFGGKVDFGRYYWVGE